MRYMSALWIGNEFAVVRKAFMKLLAFDNGDQSIVLSVNKQHLNVVVLDFLNELINRRIATIFQDVHECSSSGETRDGRTAEADDSEFPSTHQ